jgi:putative hydrolase of the HAD superfamily
MESTPRFIYFDLGNVLINFDHDRAARQMGAVAGVSKELAWEAIFADGLELKYERGDLSTQEFFEVFCERTNTTPDYDAMVLAAADIFEPHEAILPLVRRLHAAGNRLGILSNTNEAHWDFVSNRYQSLCELFEVRALSFQMRALKPERNAYEEAARIASVKPAEIFFIDDRSENVTGAREAGLDAVQFTGVSELEAELRPRGILPA